MRTDELDYHLPESLIAQHPCAQRDESRLLVLDRGSGAIIEDVYRNVAKYLRAGDCLVLNDTRVIRARLLGKKPTGARIEVFLLREVSPGAWDALVRPSAKVKPGKTVLFGDGIEATVESVIEEGKRRVVFNRPDVLAVLECLGRIPLPPYIHRDGPEDGDLRRYQTVYAAQAGAVAAPTAGLHLTKAVFDNLEAAGIGHCCLTLHVGYGTFKPVTAEQIEDHRVDAEDFDFPKETAEKLNRCRAAGGRIVAVGTTAARVLESQVHNGRFEAGSGSTDRYIHPPYSFGAVDILQTNFHLPRSSLLALVAAFAGKDRILDAYRYAVDAGFRFYSYGDVMLIR